MGIIKKVKGVVSSKANSALDRMTDPNKEMDMIILDLEAQRSIAIKELLSYKATAKMMDESLDDQKTRAQAWEKRAMIAIKKGDDEMAKECLQRKKQCEVEFLKIKRDQAEAASYAAQLNSSRKELDTKLKMLKLRKGTMAAKLAASRSGQGDVFEQSNALFDKMDEAERRIDQDIFEQEAAMELDGEAESNLALESALLKASSGHATIDVSDDPLSALKAKMREDKEGQSKSLEGGAEVTDPKLLEE